MSCGFYPTGVTKGAGLDIEGIGVACAPVKQAGAAGGAEFADEFIARVARAGENAQFPRNCEIFCVHPHGLTKGRRGLFLTLGAVTKIENQRGSGQRIAHCAALTTAGQGKIGQVQGFSHRYKSLFLVKTNIDGQQGEKKVNLRLDHFAIGARELDEGVAFVSRILGAPPVGGGKHPLFGTHNALWRLEGRFPTYLEVIAIDPKAPRLDRPRWFGLDDPLTQARLARGPKLLTFIVSTKDAVLARKSMPVDPGAPVEVTRGTLRWLFSLPPDGGLIAGGALPYLIEWPDGVSPIAKMSEQGIELISVGGNRIGEIEVEWPCEGKPSATMLEIELRSTRGELVTFATV